MNYALIFAGGVGTRMGSSVPKQFLEIDGKSILAHTISVFNNSPLINQIIIITLKKYLKETKNIVSINNYNKVVRIVNGGTTAFESQLIGVEVLHKISLNINDIVLVHDGVRPFINDDLILKCIEETKRNGNAIVVNPAAETIAIIDKSGKINKTMPRQQCLIARAPQAFYAKDLYAAHQRAKKENKQYIDSASMFLDQGTKLNPIIGPSENIKITTQYDYLLAKLLIERKNESDR